MTTGRSCLLTVNGGSSSLTFAIFPRDASDRPRTIVSGRIERIGLPDARAILSQPAGGVPESLAVSAPDPEAAADWLIDWLGHQVGRAEIAGIAHRVVHGGTRHVRPERSTPDVVADLRRLIPMDPDHLPGEIGENAPAIRARICQGLEFLGIALDPRRNASGAPLISIDGSRTQVRVIPTEEESMIAQAVLGLLARDLSP